MFVIRSVDDFKAAIDHLKKMKAGQSHRTKGDVVHTKGYMAAMNDVEGLLDDWAAQTQPNGAESCDTPTS